MRLLKTPLLVALRAAYWVPMGLVLLPARDAAVVLGESLATLARHASGARRRHGAGR